MFAQQLLEDRDRPGDPRRIVLALHAEADLLLLEPVEHIGLRNRVKPLVVDLPDSRFFTDEDVENGSLGSVFFLDADVFKVAGVPQGVEVALYSGRVVIVADVRIEAGEDRFFGDTALTDDPDIGDDIAVLREGWRNGAEEYGQVPNPLSVSLRRISGQCSCPAGSGSSCSAE